MPQALLIRGGRVIAPIGYTRTMASRFAVSTMKRVVEAESFTGVVLGIAHTAVKPPAAAARAPVAMVSLSSRPGSRRWVWMSMKPGVTTQPVASKTSAFFALRPSPIWAIRPLSIRTSTRASRREAGSITRPPRIRSA
jgi:hypothetical protein